MSGRISAPESSNTCVKCGRRFGSAALLDEHVQAAHAAEAFSCDEILDHWISSAPKRRRR